MTKRRKTMEEQLNEDILAEQAEEEAAIEAAQQEAKDAKKNKKDGILFIHILDTKTKLKLTLKNVLNI